MLTPQQELFCKYVEIEKLSQYEAYIKAYPSAAKWTRDTVYVKASNLANKDKIVVRRKELRAEQTRELRQEAKWTRDDAYNNLIWLLKKAKAEAEAKGELSSPIVSAMTKAIDSLNELYNVNSEDQKNGLLGDILDAMRCLNDRV